MNNRAGGDHAPKLPQEFLIDLAASEVRLVGVFLAAADSASRHADERLEAETLKKAFVTYCQATVRIAQLPEEERDFLAVELREMRERLQHAYADDDEVTKA